MDYIEDYTIECIEEAAKLLQQAVAHMEVASKAELAPETRKAATRSARDLAYDAISKINLGVG